MSKGTRKCKVCGKEYEYCKTYRPTDTFRWQDVACSKEHGMIYLERIRESRVSKASKKDDIMPNAASSVDEVIEESPVEAALDVVEIGATVVSDQDDTPESVTECDVCKSCEDDKDEDDWFDDNEDDGGENDEDTGESYTSRGRKRHTK